MYEDELIMLILGCGISLLLGLNYSFIKHFPFSKYLFFAFYLLLLAWLFTILEGFWLSSFFNLIEHMAYAISAVLVSLWCYLALYKRDEVQ